MAILGPLSVFKIGVEADLGKSADGLRLHMLIPRVCGLLLLSWLLKFIFLSPSHG